MILNRARNKWGEITITQKELCEQTGWSRTTLWREMSTLEEKNVVDTIRTRRNWGKLYKNRYEILVDGFKYEIPEVRIKFETESEIEVEPVENICFTDETSTSDYDSYSSHTSYKQVNTTYLLDVTRQKSKGETKVVNKWDDDDDLGGFGLLDSDIKPKEVKVTKNSASTRNQRPRAEWTTKDVAAEFSSRLYKLVANIPNLAPGGKLGPILAKYRKENDTTALIELEIMDQLFQDTRQVDQIRKEPHRAMSFYLHMLKTNFNKAVRNLEMKQEVDTAPAFEYVYAKDGTRFDNSMFGRLQLKKYEDGKSN
jgi:DNA-binding Lrp family transcriptional regulator